MDLKALDVSLKQRNCSVNSDYGIILIGLPNPSSFHHTLLLLRGTLLIFVYDLKLFYIY